MLGEVFSLSSRAMLMSRTAILLRGLYPYNLQQIHSDCFFTPRESVMKKFVPFVFIAIMAGLIGAKVAIAGEVSSDVATTQLELRN